MPFPEDSPDKMLADSIKFAYSFPYLYDETQEVAKAYRAACTPDFFLFTKDKKLFYRGQMDDSRPGNGIPVTGKDLKACAGRRAFGSARFSGPETEHRVQYQVETGERTRLFLPLTGRPFGSHKLH